LGDYAASEGSIGSLLLGLTGLGITLMFGGLFIDALLDLAAFPATPTALSVAEAVRIEDPPRGSWVKLTDARIDCRYPPRQGNSGSDYYLFLTDATGGPKVMVSTSQVPLEPARCEAWSAELQMTGVLGTMSPGRVVGLDWPGLSWEQWPTPKLSVLWTGSGPDDAFTGAWFFPLFLLLGFPFTYFGFRGAWRSRRPRRAPPPKLDRSLPAMPLATGSSVVRSFAVTIGGFQILTFAPLFVAEYLPGWMSLPLGILAALWFFAVVGTLVDGWKRRASDLVLAPEGLLIRGGPMHHLWRPWRSLQPERTAVLRGSEASELGRLLIEGEVAAAALDPDELRSLETLAETLRGLALQAQGEQTRRPGPAGAVHCPGCGAPVPLLDAEEVPCHRCGAPVRLPPAARAQLSALGQLEGARRRSERLIEALLRQPGAYVTNVLLLCSIPPLLLGWPAAAVLYDELHQTRHLLSGTDGVALFLAAFAFTYGLSWLVRAQVVGREAIRVVSSRFAAIPPENPGDPPSCHSCGAVLPQAATAQLVSICAYCQSENLSGINLAPGAAREAHQAGDLGRELERRLARRRRLRLISLGSLLLLGAAASLLSSRVL
jgi:hypothetical protein